MKICILMQNVQTPGGVQRVIVGLSNELIHSTSDLSIYLIFPQTENQAELFKVNSQILQFNLNDYVKKPTFLEKEFSRVNRLTGIFRQDCFSKLTEFMTFPKNRVLPLIDFIEENQIDLIVGVSAYYSVLAAVVGRYTGVRTVAWMHSTYESYFEVRRRPAFGLRGVFSRYSTIFDPILVLNEEDVSTFQQKFPGIHKPKIQLNPILSDSQPISTVNQFLMCYVGRLSFSDKGVDRLVEILRLVKARVPNVSLSIIGEGPDEKELRAMFKDADLLEHVKFYGQVKEPTDILKYASVLVVPSRNEGFGMVIIEAFSVGVPVVSFRDKGPASLIQDDVNGFIVEQEAIEEFAMKVLIILNDPKKHSSLRKNALRTAKKFNRKAIVIEFKQSLRI